MAVTLDCDISLCPRSLRGPFSLRVLAIISLNYTPLCRRLAACKNASVVNYLGRMKICCCIRRQRIFTPTSWSLLHYTVFKRSYCTAYLFVRCRLLFVQRMRHAFVCQNYLQTNLFIITVATNRLWDRSRNRPGSRRLQPAGCSLLPLMFYCYSVLSVHGLK